MKNYINLGKPRFGNWTNYIYLDTDEYLAKSLFIRHLIHVRKEGIMARENEKYQLVILKVLKKDEQKFLQAMEELKGKMLLFGHRDYESHGGEMMDLIRDGIRKEARETGRVTLPLGGSIRADALPEL